MHKKLLLTLFCFVLTSCQSSNKDNTSSDSKRIIQELFSEADIKVGGTRPWDITVHNEAFYDRLLSDGSVGLGESYMDGWWDAEHLDQFMYRLFRADLDNKLNVTWSMRWYMLKAYLFNLQDKLGAKKVIDEHYQLGNDLYVQMLDPTMAYSCGYWSQATTLEEAQIAKYDLICRKLGFKPGMKVLDIGCGWGGFAKYAARTYGVSVVGVTLSENQAEYAKKITQGLPIEIQVKDYRDMHGSFDRVVSIGMFEHVGKKNFDAFMQVASKCLKSDGLMLLHTIGRNTSSLVTDPWIHKYIFPNGQLPSIQQIGESMENIFVMEDWHNFGSYYDKTLMAWYKNFERSWPYLQKRYDSRFYRMWKFYLLSCAGCFRSRAIQLWQIVLSKEGVEGGYTSVR